MKKKCMGAMRHSFTKSNITTIQTMILLGILAPGSESTEEGPTNWYASMNFVKLTNAILAYILIAFQI